MRSPFSSVLHYRQLHQALKSTTAPAEETLHVLGRRFEVDSMTNVTPAILSRLERKLLCNSSSPLSQLRNRIQKYFSTNFPDTFKFYQIDDPIVRPEQNFDELLIAPSHPSRSPSDTYYINRHHMLRTHMTSHERTIMSTGQRAFLLAGDVYRRDEIDATHMPVFHQLEGVRIFTPDQLLAKREEYSQVLRTAKGLTIDPNSYPAEYDPMLVKLTMADLYITLNGLIKSIFGPNTNARWIETFFPFTQPSLEAEIDYNGKGLELFGSGVLQKSVLHSAIVDSTPYAIGWAFGLGLERLSMVLHEIPDIRLFWSEDIRFTSQFECDANDDKSEVAPVKFIPFSKYPPIVRDISFFLDDGTFQPNDFYEMIRNVAGDLIESVQLVDEYRPPERAKVSRCYRVIYRAMDRTLTDEFVNELQSTIRRQAIEQLGVTPR